MTFSKERINWKDPSPSARVSYLNSEGITCLLGNISLSRADQLMVQFFCKKGYEKHAKEWKECISPRDLQEVFLMDKSYKWCLYVYPRNNTTSCSLLAWDPENPSGTIKGRNLADDRWTIGFLNVRRLAR